MKLEVWTALILILILPKKSYLICLKPDEMVIHFLSILSCNWKLCQGQLIFLLLCGCPLMLTLLLLGLKQNQQFYGKLHCWMYCCILLDWWFLRTFERVDLWKFLTNRIIAKHFHVRVCVLFYCIPSFCLFSLLFLQMSFHFLIYCFFIFLILYFLFVPSWLGDYFIVWFIWFIFFSAKLITALGWCSWRDIEKFLGPLICIKCLYRVCNDCV